MLHGGAQHEEQAARVCRRRLAAGLPRARTQALAVRRAATRSGASWRRSAWRAGLPEADGAALPPACHSARTYALAMRPAARCAGAFEVLRVSQVQIRSRRWSATSAHTRACSKPCCVKCVLGACKCWRVCPASPRPPARARGNQGASGVCCLPMDGWNNDAVTDVAVTCPGPKDRTPLRWPARSDPLPGRPAGCCGSRP